MSIVALIGSVSVFVVIAGHVPSHSMSDATQRGASPATLMMHGWDAEIGRSAKQMQLLNVSLRHAQMAAYEHERYIQKTKCDLEQLALSSKKWWSGTNSLPMKAQRLSAVPSLKRRDGSWATSSSEKTRSWQHGC